MSGFSNPIAPPKLVTENYTSPEKTFSRELYVNCKDIFIKVDTWQLSYYCKYLGICTLIKYYSTLHLRKIPRTVLNNKIQDVLNNSIKIFDGKYLPKISEVSDTFKSDILNTPNDPILQLQVLIASRQEIFPKDPNRIENNVAYKIYESLRGQLNSALSSFLVDDKNYEAIITRNSMELLFLDLLMQLQPYRDYFQNNSLIDLYTFQNLEKSVSKVSYDDSETKNNVLLSKVLNTKGLSEIQYQKDKDWKLLFNEVYNLVSSILSKYSSVSNILYSSILNSSNQEKNNLDIISNFNSALIFKINTTNNSKVVEIDTSEFIGNADFYLTDNWIANRIAYYYNDQNIKIYNKIISYSEVNKQKQITFENNVTLSSSNKYLTFLLIKTAPSKVYTFKSDSTSKTFTRSDRSPFTVLIKKNDENFKEEIFSFTDDLLNTNILNFGTPDKIKNAGFYNNNLATLVNNSNLSLSSNIKISLAKDGNWIKASKIEITGPNILSVNQSVQGSGIFAGFYISTGGIKYFSIDVPEAEANNFSQYIDCYIIKNKTSSLSPDSEPIELKLTPTASNGITTFKSEFNIEDSEINTIANTTTKIATQFSVVLHFKSNSTDDYNIKFTSLIISETNDINSYTFSTIDDFIKKIYSASSNKYSFINNLSISKTTSGELKISTEPNYLGSEYSLKITSSKFIELEAKSIIGKDPIILSKNGKEEEFYKAFISYLKKLFLILNNYALARLIVPEAFEPEDFFNNDIKVKVGEEEQKSIDSDLLEDSGKTIAEFGDTLNSDPRAKFLQETSPKRDFPTEITWKSGSLSSFMSEKDLASIKTTLNTVKTILKTVKSLLDAVRAFIEILSALLELAEDLFSVLLETVIGQIEKVINNLSSTGLYFLPLWELYVRKTKTKNWMDLITEVGYNRINGEGELSKKWKDNHDKPNRNFDIDNRETNQLLYDIDNLKINAAANITNQKSGYEGDEKTNNYLDTLLPFRSTDYQEFIDDIINCLTDENDLPYAGDFKKFDVMSLETLGNIFSSTSRNTFLKPGAPTWSSGTTVKVMIGALTFPAPETFRGAGLAFATLAIRFLKILRKITGFTNVSEKQIKGKDIKDKVSPQDKDDIIQYKKELENNKKNQERQKQYMDNSASETKLMDSLKKEETLLKQKLQAIFNKYENEADNIQRIINELELFIGVNNASENNNDSKIDISDPFNTTAAGIQSMFIIDGESFADYTAGLNNSFGEPPNFWGVSLGSLFPGVFTPIKFLLNKLRKWNRKQDGPTLSETLEEWLEWFEEKISEIEDIIYLIDQIVELIDAILGISLTYLIIDTTNGVSDIIAQLQSASGFPNEDKNQIILGFFAGFGLPNVDDPSLDLSSYFSAVSTEFNQDAMGLINDLKLQNESDGIGFINKILPK